MTVLRNIEAKIESLFEGVFGRAFRTNVQPVELARKLVKEMEDHRVISVSRLYVPNEYTLYLSPADRAQFADYEESLLSELQDYLAENARREKYVMLSAPRVLMETDSDLDIDCVREPVSDDVAGCVTEAPGLKAHGQKKIHVSHVSVRHTAPDSGVLQRLCRELAHMRNCAVVRLRHPDVSRLRPREKSRPG